MRNFKQNKSQRPHKLLHYLATIFILVYATGCSSSNDGLYDGTDEFDYWSADDELFSETDAFVESLSTTYESYGILNSSDYSKTTSDGLYSITPIGRLVNVKILNVVPDEEYEDLRDLLKEHYEDDSRVNAVYICQGGTVMIDCRN